MKREKAGEMRTCVLYGLGNTLFFDGDRNIFTVVYDTNARVGECLSSAKLCTTGNWLPHTVEFTSRKWTI